jgi:hypothetical protein
LETGFPAQIVIKINTEDQEHHSTVYPKHISVFGAESSLFLTSIKS